jgi:atlastin
MASEHSFGKPVNILNFTNSKEIIIDESEFDKIFNHGEVQDRKVVILSIIGAFRGGKSFFLDYCLRFLYAHVSISNLYLNC